MSNKLTRSQEAGADATALWRARNPLLWIVTGEEARVERHLFKAAADAAYVARTWDCAQGFAGMDGRKITTGDLADGVDIGDALRLIESRADNGNERGVWILRDLPVWFGGGLAGAATLRQVRNLARKLPSTKRESAQALVVLSPDNKVPPELANHATVIEWPLPDRAEIASILDAAIESLPEEWKSKAAPNGQRDAAIDAAVGLTGEEAAACYARSLVQHRRIDPATVASEKKRVIAREGVLEWLDPLPGGLDDVGGLDVLKSWLLKRKLAYSPKARAYGLQAPRGVFAAGISGCGKTYTAKAAATALGEVPLLRLDPNALKSKFVGESEAQFRKALKVIEALGRCVVLIDEIEKALQGATSDASDGGVSADALGALLTWMNERKGEAFIFATANDITKLPPELMRKGRFDELFWVDLPTDQERSEILEAALKKNGRVQHAVDVDRVSAACKQFTGAEVASLVPEALFTAFADGEREIDTGDLLEAAKGVVPLAETAKAKIDAMRDWAKGKAKPATSVVGISGKIAEQKEGRVLDF